jgi:hypothetical protein
VQTDKTISNYKPDVIIRDNKRGTCMLIDVAITGDRNGVKKEAYNILNIHRPYNINSANVECESKSDTGNTRGNENHLKIT